MKCRECNNEISDNIEFCPFCGQGQSVNRDVGKDWYYVSNNIRMGPSSIQELIIEAEKGNISRTSLVWKKGMENWLPAELSPIAYIFHSVMPETPSYVVNNKYVWALAALPLCLSWFVTYSLELYELEVPVTILLNILFLSLDIKALKKSGKDAEGWVWLGLILVPVYLFIRASKTDKKYGYAITWCVLFFLDILMSL